MRSAEMKIRLISLILSDRYDCPSISYSSDAELENVDIFGPTYGTVIILVFPKLIRARTDIPMPLQTR